MGNHLTTFFTYERGDEYFGIGFIISHYISQPFDHLPTRQEIEKHFESDERFKQYFK